MTTDPTSPPYELFNPDAPNAPGLGELLERLEEAWNQGGATQLSDQLAPGISEDEVRSRLDRIGLVASDEVITWYAWHHGYKNEQPHNPWFCPLGQLDSMDRGLIMYRVPLVWDMQRGLEMHDNGWWPLVDWLYGSSMVVDARQAGTRACAAGTMNGELIDPVPSLTIPVALWIHQWDTGRWIPDSNSDGVTYAPNAQDYLGAYALPGLGIS